MIAYNVSGAWPFPADMLRKDDARAASDRDQASIDRLTLACASDRESLRKPVKITLVTNALSLSIARKRWESFGWQVREETIAT